MFNHMRGPSEAMHLLCALRPCDALCYPKLTLARGLPFGSRCDASGVVHTGHAPRHFVWPPNPQPPTRRTEHLPHSDRRSEPTLNTMGSALLSACSCVLEWPAITDHFLTTWLAHGTLKVPCQIPFLLSLLAAVKTCPELPKAVMTKFGSDGGNFLAVRIAPVDSLSPKRLELGPSARHAT